MLRKLARFLAFEQIIYNIELLMKFISIYLLLLNMVLQFPAKAQTAAINFHHLGVQQGMNDGIINAITKDKYGYLWFASFGALNQYNGSTIKRYQHVLGDSTSAPGGIVYTLLAVSNNELYIGSDEGLSVFNYTTGKFSALAEFRKTTVTALKILNGNTIIVVADYRLYVYDIKTKQSRLLPSTAEYKIYGLYTSGSLLYASTKGGYLIFDAQKNTTIFKQVVALHGANADEIVLDAAGNIWVNNVFNFKLIKVNAVTAEETAMENIVADKSFKVQQSFLDFKADSENVWIATSLTGLIQYNIKNGQVTYHRKNVLKPGSIGENILRNLYIDDEGIVWVSLLGGVDYFHPSKNIFNVLQPFPGYEDNQFARGFSEDKEGNYWFTTGDGVTRFNTVTKQYTVWRNETGKAPALYYNSSRAVLAEGNNVWIATGKGINRYDLAAHKMYFLTEKDSLPQAFYLNINKDTKGHIWFCTNQKDGLYYYDPADQKIHSIRSHPVLKKFAGYAVRRVFEDAHQRLWIGFDKTGMAMYDPASATTRYWFNSTGNDSSFNSNLIIDITEDKKGIIWATTFNGVRGVDPVSLKTFYLSTTNGWPSNVTNGIKADAQNRLWISTSAGLVVVDSSRSKITSFESINGFTALSFMEHQAHVTANGQFVFPAAKGYVFFDPSRYEATSKTFPFFIAAINVEGKTENSYSNFKELNKLSLEPDENFFTITLEGLNYTTPEQTWYAYKMDGLEKEWHYTQDPHAVYTSMPGGTYTFRYKATAGSGNWTMPEKKLTIIVQKNFYKTAWFWCIMAAILFVLMYIFYRYRLQQQQKLFTLETKTQKLEKEKTQVMYDSLKQQLNPHFLFNSLTSLSGLIETNQQLAGAFLKQMSKIYRYILKSRDNELVKLKEEIDFVQTYITLQQTRFKKGLYVNFSVEEDMLEKKLPPVTLQNLIENAIKHNIIDEETPLQIDIVTEQNYLVVKNNLQRKPMVETSNKQGLISLQSLYSYLTKKPLIIEEDENIFCIKVPLL